MSGGIRGDAQAALGIINTNGLGKTRHIDTGLPWTRPISAQRRFKFNRVLGTENPADLYTKYLDWEGGGRIGQHAGRIRYNVPTSRAQETPNLHCTSQQLDEYNLMGDTSDWKQLPNIVDVLQERGCRKGQ